MSYQSYVYSYFDAFEKWMMREKIWSKSNKISVIRFIQKCRKLARYFDNPSYPEKKIVDLFDENESVQASSWLKERRIKLLNQRKRTPIN